MITVRPQTTFDLAYTNLKYSVDCRMLFTGDRIRQIIRAYGEILYRYDRSRNPDHLFRSLQSSAEIQQFYEAQQENGKVSVVLRDSVFRQSGPLEDLYIDLKVSRGKDVFLMPLPLNRFRALGHLLPLLTGNHEEGEILPILKERLSAEETAWAIALKGELIQKGFLQNIVPERNWFERATARPQVTFLGHTSLLLQSESINVVTDPIMRFDFRLPWHAFDLTRLKIGAICISHSHWDHCDLQTLLWFQKDTPVFIPRIKNPSVFNPPIREPLELLGFTNIQEVNIWEPAQIEDIELIPVPFYGEQDEPYAEIDHYTYVLKTKGMTVYGGVDCYEDTFGKMNEVIERVYREHRPDIAFLPISRNIYWYKYGGVNGFCRYLNSDLLQESFQYTASAEEAAAWVKLMTPRWVSPYATFTFSRWSTPRQVDDFAAALSKLNLDKSLLPLRPLDFLSSSHLNGSAWMAIRSYVTVIWFRAGGRIGKIDRRWNKRNRYYRFVRRQLLRLFA